MRTEPPTKCAIAFFDGQNLFHSAKEAFGYTYPNYDPAKLAITVCDRKGWRLEQVCFYTGYPEASDNVLWNHFWRAKLAVMGTRAVKTFSRPLRYRNKRFACPDGRELTLLVGQEKGIDIRLALDVVRKARNKRYDVAVIFSQDQDLSEAADEVRAISVEQDRWIKVVSAFPASPTSRNTRGINGTDWLRIDKAAYDASIDSNDYRPRNS